MIKLLHFADAHIDMATHGRHDPETGLPLRVMDFLKSLDGIVDTAIQERVDLVLFAGDAYKDRTPAPTFQREWGKRIMRLSAAGIPTLLLVGNHDLSPATGRANALQEFDTLQVPHVRLISKPEFLRSSDLEGLPLQIMALPWLNRSSIMAALQLSGSDPGAVFGEIEARVGELVEFWFKEMDPSLPTILTAHASVQGAVYGGERSVMLGSDMVLPLGMLTDPRLDYVALGHIHKAQDVNNGAHPPVVYPGSIERVDFGEAADDKYFVIATLEKGKETIVKWQKLPGRKFVDRFIRINAAQTFQKEMIAALPPQEELVDAMLRLVVEYPRQWETMMDEASLRQYAETAFEFHLVRRPQLESRLRIPADQVVNSLSQLELLDLYWKSIKTKPDELEELQKLASEIIFAGQSESE